MARQAPKPPPEDDPDEHLLKRDKMITKGQLALFLGIPEGTLDHWASRGSGPVFCVIGNHRKYWTADVRAWLSTRRYNINDHGERVLVPWPEIAA